MYGTKQSSKPYFTIDSIPVISECSTSNESNEVPFTEQTTNNSKCLVKKLENVPKREASTGSSLEAREKVFNEKLEKVYAEKMQRMDRFLDLFERSIKNKERDKAYIKWHT